MKALNEIITMVLIKSVSVGQNMTHINNSTLPLNCLEHFQTFNFVFSCGVVKTVIMVWE